MCRRYTVMTVDKAVVRDDHYASWERPMIYVVPRVQDMGEDTEELQMMRKELKPRHKGICILTQVRLLVNPHTSEERWQNGETAGSSVLVVVKWSNVAK